MIRPNGEVIRDGQIIGRLDRDSADPPPPGLLQPPRAGLKPQPTTLEEESPAETPARPRDSFPPLSRTCPVR